MQYLRSFSLTNEPYYRHNCFWCVLHILFSKVYIVYFGLLELLVHYSLFVSKALSQYMSPWQLSTTGSYANTKWSLTKVFTSQPETERN